MNRNKFVHIRILVSSLCVLCVLCVSISAQQWKPVADGVEYAEVRRDFSGKAVNINLLRLDLKKVRLDVHHAMDSAIGTEKTSSIATRHNAFAAINAGFFRLDKSEFAGDASGVLKIDGKLLSEGRGRGDTAIALLNERQSTRIAIVGVDLHRLLGSGKKVLFVGTNRERKENDIVEYTPHFGKVTPVSGKCVEVVVRLNRIASIAESCGNPIPQNGYVISASGEKMASLRSFAAHGVEIETNISTVMDDARPTAIVEKAEDIVSGRGRLIRDSKLDTGFSGENKAFVETRHPRTAVAKLKDGKFLMLTADGRTEQSAGLDLYDLAAYFLELGATDAMNLDGGGSTTMFLDGKVVNKPSDKEGERKVGDAILVTLRKKK